MAHISITFTSGWPDMLSEWCERVVSRGAIVPTTARDIAARITSDPGETCQWIVHCSSAKEARVLPMDATVPHALGGIATVTTGVYLPMATWTPPVRWPMELVPRRSVRLSLVSSDGGYGA